MLGGADYAVSDLVSLGVKVRWARFGRFAAEGIEWEQLRSHESQLWRDDSEPVTFQTRSDGPLSFIGISMALRYVF